MSAAVGVLAGDRRQARAALAEAVGRQQASPSGLLAAARDGDAQAFTALVQAFQFSVYHFILRMVRRPTTAEDLSQEVFIRLWRHLGEIQSAEMLPGWLRRVAANAVIDHWRKEEARERRLRILREHPVARYVVRPSSRLESQESLGVVRASLEALPARLRSVLLLRTVEGLSYEEVGQTLGLSVHAVRSRLFRARQELHKILKHKKAADHLARMYQPARGRSGE